MEALMTEVPHTPPRKADSFETTDKTVLKKNVYLRESQRQLALVYVIHQAKDTADIELLTDMLGIDDILHAKLMQLAGKRVVAIGSIRPRKELGA